MKKPTLNVTESDIKDVFALMTSGYVGSWDLQESIDYPPHNVNDFANASLEEIKEDFRKRMQDNVKALQEYSIEDNLFLPDGKSLADIGASSRRLQTEGDLPLSEHGLGITGTFEVEMADGTVKLMDLTFAPVITVDDEAMHNGLLNASYDQENGKSAYLLEKYGDSSLKDDRSAYVQSAWDNIPDTVLDLRDTLYRNPYGLDWNDLTPHTPDLAYGKTSHNKTNEKLNESLVSEASELENDKQYE